MAAVRSSDHGLEHLVAELVAIDSVNPDLVAGGAGEAAIGDFVAGWLTGAGLDVRVDEVRPGRPNVVAVARGRGGGRSLLLLAHTDTVAVGQMREPHHPRVERGRLHGRGAYDMKAGLAAAMSAAATVSDLAGDVIVAAVCDEEAGSAGTRALLAGALKPDAAIVTEPTELGVVVAHKGFVGFQITTTGVAAHGSMPELGVDAILAMGPILAELRALDQRLQTVPPHPLLGTASLHASLIEGGQEFSTYPARCVLTGEARVLPDTTGIEDQLRAAVTRAGADAEVDILFTGDPFEAPADQELTGIVREQAGTAIAGAPYWCDAALLAEHGIPTVVFGPAGEGAHADVEWVDLQSVERTRDTLVAVAETFCGRA